MPLPVVKLGGGFFWYFAALGLFAPWWPLYLSDRGFGALQIGLLMGVFSALRVLGPPVVAHWADASGQRLRVARATAAAAIVAIMVFPWLDGFCAFAVLLACYSAAWNGLLSVYDAHVLGRLRADTGRYARLRLWGSIGFILTSAAGGWWLGLSGIGALPWSIAALLGLALASLLSLDAGHEGRQPAPRTPLGPSFADRRVWVFLLVAFLMVASMGAYNNFFSLLLERHGYSRGAIGLLWAWGATAEIAVFAGAPWLLARYSLRAIMISALALTALRWIVLVSFIDVPAIVFASQTLHLASFGLFHLASVALAQTLFPPAALARGQSLLGSLGYGLGGMSGALASGWLWDHVGPESPYLAAVLVVLCALGVAVAGLRPGPYR